MSEYFDTLIQMWFGVDDILFDLLFGISVLVTIVATIGLGLRIYVTFLGALTAYWWQWLILVLFGPVGLIFWTIPMCLILEDW